MGKYKFGICEWSLPANGQYGCQIARMMGLDGIELNLGDYERSFPLSKKEMQKIYLAESEKWEIEYTAMAVNALCDHGFIAEKGSEEYDIGMAAVKSAIDACVAMNIKLVQIPSFFHNEIKTERDFNQTVQCLKEACQYAEKRNIRISSENVLSADDMLRLLDEMKDYDFRLYYDSQNYKVLRDFNATEIFKRLSPYVCELHIKDGFENMSTHLLGEGNSNFFETAKAIKESPYEGWIHLENYYDQPPMSLDEDPYKLMKQDIAIAKKVFG